MAPPPATPARLRGPARLQGVVAVVGVGSASSALAARLAARLAADGAAVVVVSADGAGAGAVAADIRAAGGRADVVVTDDPPSPDDLEAAVEMVAEVHRR